MAWFVIDAVGVMELSAFYAGYREDGLGRAAYEPSMMVALVLYCWSRGMRSSRWIERACLEDVACRVIAANQRPDHATIPRLIESRTRLRGASESLRIVSMAESISTAKFVETRFNTGFQAR